MRRFRLPLLLSIAASALAVAPALAGGWATVIVDQASITGWQPGEPQQVEVTLMQHGVTPVNDGTVHFTLTNAASGETTTVTARRTGDGRWTATLTAAAAGDWSLVVLHSGLDTTQAGPISITVGGAAAATAPATAATGTGSSMLVLLLVVGVALAAMAAVAVILVARPERGGARRAG